MNRFQCFFLSFSAALLLVCGSSPGATVFDFETEATTYNALSDASRPGALTTLTLSEDEHTIFISRGGIGFDLVANSGVQTKPAPFGGVSLETFHDQGDAPFTINFSPPVQQFSLTWGDYDGIPSIPEDNDVLMLKAYSGADGTGTLVGSTQDFLTNAEFSESNAPDWPPRPGFSYETTSVSGGSIASVVLIGGSDEFPHSLFYDSIEVVTVPEPMAWGMSLLLLVLFRHYR